jgi:alanine racemase
VISSHETPALPDARTWIEIDLEALRHNCRAAQACFPDPAPGVLAVVKADGYGLGMVPVARAMQDLVRALAVANVTEARVLREAGFTLPIYILGPALPSEWEAVAAGGFCPAISTLEEVSGYAQAAARQGHPLPVHVVIDTGMGRLGALPGEAAALLSAVLDSPFLKLDSVASHFPSADDDPSYTEAQANRFKSLITEFRASGLAIGPTQLANSAGLTAYPQTDGSWARAGLMLYGVSPVPRDQTRLRPVVTWKTRIALIRELPAGHGISYGRTFITTRPTWVATLPVGYADGFPRQASGQGAAALIAGCRCPVLGRITMDQIMVDVTDLPDRPAPGDEVVLVGRQGNLEITAPELAAQGGTVAWDLFTGLGPRVRRCYSVSCSDSIPHPSA